MTTILFAKVGLLHGAVANHFFGGAFGDFHTCPMYTRINEEAAKARRLQAIQPLITVTYNGHTELLHARAS